MSQEQAYPLRWPEGWPRTKSPGKSAFATRTVNAAADELERQLSLLGASHVVLSSNVTLRGSPEDRGVCVYFRMKNRPYALPCDKWSKVEDNLWALAKHVEGLRASERWGVGTVERVFEGYASLPPPGSSAGGSWWDVLGCGPNAAYEVARAAYRVKAQQHHPDTGGNAEDMARVNAAWDQCRALFKQP